MTDSPTGTARVRGSRFGPFRHRAFAIYWAGGVLSNLGTWLQAVAGSIFVYQLTGSALAVGIFNFAGFLPILLFSLAGGVISDRIDRRLVVIVTHSISVVLAAGLALVTLAGAVVEWQLIVVAFGLNTSYAVAKPALQSILPSLVPKDEITDAVGLNTFQFIAGQIAGPIVAALAIATVGAGWAFAINALTFVGPIASMLYLRRRGLGGRTAEGRPGGGGSTSSDWNARAFIREHRWVLALLGAVITSSVPLEIVRTMSPALVVEDLGATASAAGFIVAAQSVGSAIALLAFIPLRRRGWSHRLAAVGLLTQAAGLIATGIVDDVGMAAVSVGMVGFGFSLSFPVFTGALQTEVPDGVRGRIMAVHTMAHLGHRPFTALIAGGLATLVGPQPAIIVGAILAPLGLISARRAWHYLLPAAEPVATASTVG